MISSKTVLGFVIILCFQTYIYAQFTQSVVVGSTVQLLCPLDGRNDNYISWNIGIHQLSFGSSITANDVPDMKPRLSITGDDSAGEYHLTITNITNGDQREYNCYGSKNPSTVYRVQLTVIVGPTHINIINKISDKVQGTEDSDLTVTCTAGGGDPAPDLTLQIGSDVYKVNRQHTILHTIQKISRSYDGVTVTCKTGYDGITYTPLTDTAGITLYLKPLTPTFSKNPVVAQNTKLLVISCISTGSRPAPTERIWFIENVNITPSSTLSSPTQQPDGTFNITSTLTYKFSKAYNGKDITCGFKNIATANGHVIVSEKIDVQYSPVVSVQNTTFTLTQTSRKIQSVIDSNPNVTHYKWQHMSKYGELIRELNGNSTLVLPPHIEEDRYQDTGEYVCTVSNGIKDEDGKLDQRGSGYVISTAPPRYLDGSNQVKLGQFGKDVTIDVSVYSVPKYSTPTWLKDGIPLPRTCKYTTGEVSDVITDTFYDTRVQVDGYRLSLFIQSLVESDFVNYTLRLTNGVGQIVEHRIELVSASPPETPAYFLVSDETESSVTLHWIARFDGGHKQWFIAQYRSVGTQTWQETEIPDLIQFTDDGFHSFILPGLPDGTSYDIRMYAGNKFNKSLPTDTKQISTKGALHCLVEKSTFTSVVAVLTSVIMVSLSLNGYFLFTRIRGKRLRNTVTQRLCQNCQNLSKTHLSPETESPDVYLDITNNQEDDRSRQENHGYETLGTVDKPNVYEDLDQGTNEPQNKIYSNTTI